MSQVVHEPMTSSGSVSPGRVIGRILHGVLAGVLLGLGLSLLLVQYGVVAAGTRAPALVFAVAVLLGAIAGALTARRR
jgi:hypothetical protein